MSRPGSIPVRSFKQAVPILVAMAVFVGGAAWAAFLLDMEEVFGITVGWSWSLVDSGQVEVVALTPKITDVDAPPAFLLPGEQLEATIDFRIERGIARVIVADEGWFEFGWPGFDEFVWLHHEANIRAPRQHTVRITAGRPGLYTVEGRIEEATGTFRLDWRVVNPRDGGRAVRLLRFLFLSLPGLLLLVLLPLVIGALLFGRRD
ncbi:MAG: hypothetical protein ACODAA_08090 [Gemmatimonadota bacterium]